MHVLHTYISTLFSCIYCHICPLFVDFLNKSSCNINICIDVYYSNYSATVDY